MHGYGYRRPWEEHETLCVSMKLWEHREKVKTFQKIHRKSYEKDSTDNFFWRWGEKRRVERLHNDQEYGGDDFSLGYIFSLSLFSFSLFYIFFSVNKWRREERGEKSEYLHLWKHYFSSLFFQVSRVFFFLLEKISEKKTGDVYNNVYVCTLCVHRFSLYILRF